LDTHRPVRRTAAVGFIVVAAVCATVVLYANPNGATRVAAAVLVGLLVVALGIAKYHNRRAASRSMEGSRYATPLQMRPATPSLPPRQTTDDYWYPAASTRDRSGTRLGGPRPDGEVASMCVEVGNCTSAPASARHALQSWFASVDCDTPPLDDALLIVSELVTNVVIHTTSGSVVTAALDDHRFRIEVHDRDPRGPVVDPELTGASRGLPVVESLCDLWGWEPTAFGKRVWTETLY
jgi:hypothetical protein